MTAVDDLGQQLTLDKTNGELYDAEGEPFDDVGSNTVATNDLPYSQHGEKSAIHLLTRGLTQRCKRCGIQLAQKQLSILPLCLDAVTGL